MLILHRKKQKSSITSLDYLWIEIFISLFMFLFTKSVFHLFICFLFYAFYLYIYLFIYLFICLYIRFWFFGYNYLWLFLLSINRCINLFYSNLFLFEWNFITTIIFQYLNNLMIIYLSIRRNTPPCTQF